MQTEYSLAKQIGKKGFYGKVRLDATLLATPGLVIDLGDEFYEWKASIELACKYFLERSPSYVGMKVALIDIEDNPVDTSSVIIVYCVVKALEKAFGFTTSNVKFDEDFGRFIFEK